ncbi:hypothetical protein HK097_006914, partial [Rhizophlyctis rosea]
YLLGLSLLKSHPSLQTHFRSILDDPTVFYITSLLHDIGTTDENLKKTKMSFELYGGILSLEEVVKAGGGREMAESVCESVVRHQDLGVRGFVSANTALVQMATIMDNTGKNTFLIHPTTLQEIHTLHPRTEWSSCFIKVLQDECHLKPYCTTLRLGEDTFKNHVMANPLDKLYEFYEWSEGPV